MKKVIIITIAAVITLCTTGCATMLTGTSQMVILTAPAGTKIYQDGYKIGEIYPGEESIAISLRRQLTPLRLIAKKDGCKQTHFELRPNVNGVIFVNILVGVWPFIVDIATGAATKYPNYVEIEMEPLSQQYYQSQPTQNINSLELAPM